MVWSFIAVGQAAHAALVVGVCRRLDRFQHPASAKLYYQADALECLRQCGFPACDHRKLVMNRSNSSVSNARIQLHPPDEKSVGALPLPPPIGRDTAAAGYPRHRRAAGAWRVPSRPNRPHQGYKPGASPGNSFGPNSCRHGCPDCGCRGSCSSCVDASRGSSRR